MSSRSTAGKELGGKWSRQGDRDGLLPAAVVHGVQGGDGISVPRAMDEGRRAGCAVEHGRTETRGAGEGTQRLDEGAQGASQWRNHISLDNFNLPSGP